MIGQIFSIKPRAKERLVLFLFIIFSFFINLPLQADPLVIQGDESFAKMGYVGKHLEILNEGVIFQHMENYEDLPADFQAILLSGKLNSDPEVWVGLERVDTGGYRMSLSHSGASEQTILHWGLEDLQKEEVSSSFQPAEDEIPLLDFTGHAYWLRLKLQNPQDIPIKLILELDKNIFSWFDLLYSQEGVIHFLQGSYEAPLDDREMQESKILFPLEVPPGEQEIYFRMESKLIDSVPLRLWQAEEFYRRNNRRKFFHGFTTGASLLLMAYALFLAYSLKESSYLYLGFLILTGFLIHLSDSGLGMTHFWPEHPMGSISLFSLAFPLNVLINLIFCRHYLQTAKQTPITDKILLFMMAASGLLAVIQFFIPINSRFAFSTIAILLDYLSVIPLLIAVLIIFRREKKGNRSSLYLLIAILFQLFSYLEFWLSRFNIIPLGMIDFLHLRSIGFVLVIMGGVKFKMALLEKTISSLREKLDEIISRKTEESSQKSLTDKTQIKVEAVKDLIEKHFTQPLYREDLAASVDLSPDHLGRMFKRLTGVKISDYMNSLRIEEACKRLKEEQSKIIEIAFDVGFENLRTFNLCFSKIMDMSPSEYRREKGNSQE